MAEKIMRILALLSKNRRSVLNRIVALLLAITVPFAAMSTVGAVSVDPTEEGVVEQTEPVFTDLTLEADGEGCHVLVICPADAEIPSDAHLYVSEIPMTAAEYGDYYAQTQSAISKNQEISRARFFDISILSGEEEIQPAAPVSVELTLDENIVHEDEEQQVIHFGEEPETLDLQADDETLSFETDGFSVFGVVYTVDFTFGEYIYCLPGGSEILLSDLLAKLNTGASLKNSTAAFSEDMPEGLVKLEAVYDDDIIVDWKITSLAPFNTQHTLTVTLDSGAEIIIGVTDEAEWNTWTYNNVPFQWRINADGTLEVTGNGSLGAGSTGVNTYPWNNSAYSGSVKKVVIGDGITELGQYSFKSCTNIETVDFSNAHALKIIDTGAFEDISSITSIDFSGCDNLETISNHVFGSARNNGKGASVTTLDFSHCPKLKTIRNNAFQRCEKLESVNFEGTVLEEIQSSAFSRCTALESIDLSGVSTMKNIGAYAFEHCTSLQTADFHGLEQLKLAKCVFEYCTSLKTVDLSGDTSIDTLYEYSFNGCDKLEFIDFTGCNISVIQNQAFKNCKLLNVDLSSFTGVTSIGDYAFSYCLGLTNIDLSQFPDLQYLGYKAFEHCENAASINMSGLDKLTKISGCAFEYCKSAQSVDLTGCDNITEIGEYAFNGLNSKALTKIDLTSMKNLQTIGKNAFSNAGGGNAVIDLSECTHLTSVGENAFNHIGMNYGSGKVILPALKEVQTIGNSAFNETTLDLTATDGVLDFSSNTALKSVGSSAFWNVKEIEKIDLSDCTALETIGDSAFARDHRHETNLTAVDLSNAGSAEKGLVINNKAFMRHENLTDVDMTNSHVKQLGTGGSSYDVGVFLNCSKLSNVDLSGCDDLEKIERSAFYNNYSLFNIDLSECSSLTTIGQQAFTGTKGNSNVGDPLEELVIPEKVTSISSNSFLNCSSLQLIEWRAEDYGSALDQAVFTGAGNYELRIGETVGTLPSGFFRATVNAGEVYFDSVPGGHVIHLDESVTDSGQEIFAQIKNDIYVDENGVVYELFSDHTARLAYCPPGLTVVTVPEHITADGVDYTVNAIAPSALTKARDMTELHFENPSAITSVGENAAFGVRALTKVVDDSSGTEATTIRQAQNLFPNAGTVPASAFRRTGLEDDVTDYVWKDGIVSDSLVVTDSETTVEIKQPASGWFAHDDHIYDYLTGKFFSIPVSAHTSNDNGAYVHLFLDFTNSGYSGLDGDLIITDGSGGKIAETQLRDTTDPDIKCLTFNVSGGSTAAITLNITYPSPVSEGGELRIWADIVEGHDESEQITPVMNTTLNGGDHYMHARWSTERVEREPRKVALSSRVTIMGSGDPETPETFYVRASSWRIFLDRVNEKDDDKIGQDFATSAQFSDQLTLPMGIEWNPKVLETLKNGTYTFKHRKLDSKRHQYTLLVDGEEVIYLEFPEEVTAQRINFTVDENDNVLATWTIKNPKTTADLTNNPIIFGVFDKTLILDLSKVTVEKNGVLKPATEEDFPMTFEITNNVETKVSYTHSAMSEPEPASATMRAIADKANLELKKTRSGGDTMHLGDDVTFFLTAANTGAQSTCGIEYIEDTLADGIVRLLYISPENMERMFSEKFGDKLTVSIKDAKRYRWIPSDKSTVSTLTGGTAALTDKNSGELQLIDENNIISISNTDSGYRLILIPESGNTQTYTGTSIAELLNSIGYYVTENDYYHVLWDFNEEYRLMGGAEIELPIYATHKNTFQLIDEDNANSYKNGMSWSEIMTNTGYLYYSEINTLGEKEHKVIDDYITRYTVVKDVKVDKGIDTKPLENGYDNGQVVQYHLVAENSGTKDFDDMPLTDELYGSQMLLVRKDQNPSLDAFGLDTVDNLGFTYYVLKEGTYSNIYVGSDSRYTPALAESVTVEKTIDRSGNIVYTTRIYWCFDKLAANSTERINYYTIVSALDQSGNQQREYYFNNKVFLNDLKDDRLYATLRDGGATYGIDKKIVTVRGDENHIGEELDEDNHTWLTGRENTATYKLTVSFDPKQSDWSVSFTGKEIFDSLPQTFSTFNWEKGDNVSIEFVPHGNVTYSDDFVTGWDISDTAGDNPAVSGQQYIVFPDTSTLTLRGKSSLDMYVTCTFSDEENWDHYAEAGEGNLVKNTFYVNDRSAYVTHDLKTRSKAYLQKGVNYIYQIGATDSREEYGNAYGHVEYYTVLYNGGNSNLYLSDMIDTLPRGFTLRSVNNISGAYAQTGGRQAVECVTMKNKEYQRSGAKPAVIDDGEREVTFKAVKVTAEPLDNNRLKFSFEGNKADSDFAGFDKEVEMYYLAPHEAFAFTYTVDINSSVANTDSTALNRIIMEYNDPTGLGVSMYELGSGSVKGCKRDEAPYNDGECLPYEGYEGLQSYVSIRRGDPVPGITKDIVSYSYLGETHQTNDGAVVSAADTFEWNISVSNAGYNNIDGYSIIDTMEAPYLFSGEVRYKVYDSDGKTVDTIYESAGTFERPLFSVVRSTNEAVIIEDIQGSRHTIAIDGASETLTIPYIYENYSGVRNTYISDGETNYTFTVAFARDSENGNLTMTVHFNTGTLPLLPKCTGRLTVQTKTQELMTNREFVNAAVFLPDDLSYERSAVGKRLYDENGENAGVYSEAGINIVEGGGTTSLKAVEENVDPSNFTDSSDGDNNTITLADKQNDFTYTLTVTNSTKSKFESLVIADHLPEIGDHYSLRNAVPRGSEYTVHFYDENADTADVVENTITAAVKRGEDTIVLSPDTYTVMYSEKISFSNEDMRGEPDGWSATCTPSSRSIRIVFNDTADIRDEDIVSVRFKAISDSAARPSQTAYNGFVYRYDNGTIQMHAATHLVGVRIPDFPALQKKTINRFGIEDVASENIDFYFLVYEGDKLALPSDLLIYDSQGKPVLDDSKPVLTPAARAQLTDANRSYTTSKLTLSMGQSLSDVQSLYAYDFWKTGRTYTITEIPVHDSYALNRWRMETESSFLQSGDSMTFTYDNSDSQTVVAVNKNLSWRFNIHKISDFNGNSLPGAVFALYSPDSEDTMIDSGKISGNVYTYEPNLTIPVVMEYEDETWYLSRVEVTNNSGNISFNNLNRERYFYREIKAPKGFILPERTEHIVMSTDTDSAYGTVVSREITNHYGYEIPSYGGHGTWRFLMTGVPLVLASSGLLIYRRRKRLLKRIT